MSSAWTPGDPGTLSDGRTRAAFRDDFLWGTATAAYQIEGSPDADGKGPSIWDTFSHTPGKTANGETGDVACDHYRRMPEDVELMAALGVNAYRFSVSWSRVQPAGSGAVEPRGLDFYERLVDALLERGIAPALTLYHWDLPQALEDEGGWLVRDTAYRFADYAGIVAERLGDRVHTWITINEAVVVSTFGYALGTNAPGKLLLFDSFPATHHVLLAHGLGTAAVRAATPGASVGITHNLSPVLPLTDSAEDAAAAVSLDAIQNRTYMEPCLLGSYPALEDVRVPVDRACVLDGDLDVIAAPIDMIGINYYNPTTVKAPGEGNPFPFEIVPMLDFEQTDMGWPVVPGGLRDVLVQQKVLYGDALPPVMVTENGVAFPDTLVEQPTPHVDDPRRVDFLRAHFAAVGEAIDAGVDVRGFFVWSFLDNFEWAEGYRPRFGIVYTDYDTQRRIPKQSYAWLRSFLRGDA